MHPEIMNHVAGHQFEFSKAHLTGYFRSRIHSEEYPAITPREGADVPGIVYFNVNAQALSRLDAFEGEMYSRITVEVSPAKGAAYQAMVYVLKPEYKHILTGEAWSYDEFLSQGKEKFINRYFGFKEIDKTIGV